MAVPTINLNYTVLSDCDTTTGWSSGSLEPDIKQQGTNALVTGIRNNGTVTYTTGGVNMSAPDAHLRLWLFHTFAANLQTKANGGIRLFVTGGGTNFYNVGGSDTHNGAWELFQCDLANPDVDGGANLSNITAAGFALDHATAARNIDNTWWDFFVFGTGYEVTGGTSGDPVTWVDLAAQDSSLGIGMVQLINGVYFVNGELVIGDRTNGTTATHFNSTNEVAVFYSAGESSTLYKLVGDGGAVGANIVMANTVLKSAATPFLLDMDSANINALTLSGSTIASASSASFASGQTVSGTVFTGCGQITPNGATFTNNTFSEYVGTDGALLWPGGTTVTGCSFVDNTRAVQHTDAGTFDYIGMTFNGNTYDIHNSSGGAVVINASGGSNPFTSIESAGGSTTINNTVTLTITGIVPGSEVRIFEHGTINELGGVETIVGTSFAFSYNFGSVSSVDIVVHKPTYVHLRVSAVTLGANDSSIPVTQRFDRVYSNPI